MLFIKSMIQYEKFSFRCSLFIIICWHILDDSPVKVDREETLDLYDPQRVFLKTHRLEKKVLMDGMNSNTLEFTGEPDRNLVGIDFIWLQE